MDVQTRKPAYPTAIAPLKKAQNAEIARKLAEQKNKQHLANADKRNANAKAIVEAISKHQNAKVPAVLRPKQQPAA